MNNQIYTTISIIARYWFVLLGGYTMVRLLIAPDNKDIKKMNRNFMQSGVLVVLCAFTLTTFAILSCFEKKQFDMAVFFIGIDLVGIIIVQQLIFMILFKGSDPFLSLTANMLMVIGAIMLQRLDPDAAMRQLGWIALGNAAMLVLAIIVNVGCIKRYAAIVIMGLAIGLLVLPFFFGVETSGAYNWVNVKGYTFQPSEIVKILIVFMMAYLYRTPRLLGKSIPGFTGIGVLILLVVIQRDLGAALIYFCIFLCLYYIATTDVLAVIFTFVAGSVGAVLGYSFFDHVKVRLIAWENPFGGEIEYNAGYQIAQSLITIVSGGWFGTGLGLGMPYSVPAARTDFIFSAICEEMGIIFGIFIMILFMLIIQRTSDIAQKAENQYDLLIIMGSSIAIVIQAFIIIGGVTKFIPLTGVTVPFVSYGGTSMLVCFAFLGMIQGTATKIEKQQQRANKEEMREQIKK